MKKFLILSLLLCFFMTNTPLVFAESLSEKQERIEQQAQEEKNKIHLQTKTKAKTNNKEKIKNSFRDFLRREDNTELFLRGTNNTSNFTKRYTWGRDLAKELED